MPGHSTGIECIRRNRIDEFLTCARAHTHTCTHTHTHTRPHREGNEQGGQGGGDSGEADPGP